LDWSAIARILGDGSNLPVALLDKSGRIRLFNRAMEEVLGWSRFDVEGKSWAEICVSPDRGSEANRWIEEALRGAVREHQTSVLTKAGARIAFHFEFALVGQGPDQGLLVTARRAVPAPIIRVPGSGRDFDYDVSVVGAEFGQVNRLSVEGETALLTESDRRCFVLLYGLPGPCADCPLRVTGEEGWPRVRIRCRRAKLPEGMGPYFEVTTAEPIDQTLIRLRVRTISEETLGTIHRAKLHQIAEQAKLSERERDVMTYLLMGRALEDIATILQITPRTVKYHQANVLQKVGADSRLDLLRLVF
jgi:PAS domain S-box-containing protein